MEKTSRAVVFAHYDKDFIVDDYVLYYLKELRTVCNCLVFVSCNELARGEEQKLNGLADYIIAEKHSEYDFGSYKRGYFFLKNNGKFKEFDELLFVNDSCFGPLYPLSTVFEKMKNSEADFWGITRNHRGMKFVDDKIKFCPRPHIQSYFIAFRRSVFESEIFEKFMENICEHEEKNRIIEKYEIGLSETLEQYGFKSDEYVKFLYGLDNPMLKMWRFMLLFGKLPFLKCSLLRLVNKNLVTCYRWKKVVQDNFEYPVELIETNLKRTICSEFNPNTTFGYVRVGWFSFLQLLPRKPRVILLKFTSKFLKFMID